MSPTFFFGELRWTSGRPTIKTPVALFCVECGERIAEGDSGVVLQSVVVELDDARNLVVGAPGGALTMFSTPKDQAGIHSIALHEECFMRQIVGSIGHQTRRCSCFGGDYDDPPGMSKRDAAKIAYTVFLAHRAAVSEGLIPGDGDN